MRIDVLCDKGSLSDELMRDVEHAVGNVGILADIHRVTDAAKIMECGVTKPPAILIEGRLEFYNKIPTIGEIEKALEKYL